MNHTNPMHTTLTNPSWNFIPHNIPKEDIVLPPHPEGESYTADADRDTRRVLSWLGILKRFLYELGTKTGLSQLTTNNMEQHFLTTNIVVLNDLLRRAMSLLGIGLDLYDNEYALHGRPANLRSYITLLRTVVMELYETHDFLNDNRPHHHVIPSGGSLYNERCLYSI